MRRFPSVEPWRMAMVVQQCEQEGVGKWGRKVVESANLGEI